MTAPPEVLAPSEARTLRRSGLRRAAAVGAGLALTLVLAVQLTVPDDRDWLVRAAQAGGLAAILTYVAVTAHAARTAWVAARDTARSGTLSATQLRQAVHRDLVDVLDEPEAVRVVAWAEATWTQTVLLAPAVLAVYLSVAVGLLSPVVLGEEALSPWSTFSAAVFVASGAVVSRGDRRIAKLVRDRGLLAASAP